MERSLVQGGKRRPTWGRYRRARESRSERLRWFRVREGLTEREDRGRGTSPRLRGKRCRAAKPKRDAEGIGRHRVGLGERLKTNPLVGREARSWCEKWCGSGPAIQVETGWAVQVVGTTVPPKNASGARKTIALRDRRGSWIASRLRVRSEEGE